MNALAQTIDVRPNARTALNMRRSVLAPMDYVRIAHCWSVERVNAAVDTGELIWVWDISAGRRENRILRFWSREVFAPESCILLSVPMVLGLILGERDYWHTAALGDLLQCSRKHVHDLFDRRALRREDLEGTVGASREGLAKFLRERLIKL